MDTISRREKQIELIEESLFLNLKKPEPCSSENNFLDKNEVFIGGFRI